MMRYILFFIVILITKLHIVNAEDQILAVVNKTALTFSEFTQYKKLMKFFYNVSALDAEQEKVLNKTVLKAMIDETIIKEYAKKTKITIEEDELKQFIRNIEISQKLNNGYLENAIKQNNIKREVFLDKIKAQIIQHKIINNMMGENLNISKDDINSLILDTNFRDAKLKLHIFTAKDDSNSTINLMSKLSSKIKNCHDTKNLKYANFAEFTENEFKLSSFAPNIQALLKDIGIGQATQPVKDEDKLKIFVLCNKTIEGLSPEELNIIFNNYARKQVNVKYTKFLENLKKKAYIKIMM